MKYENGTWSETVVDTSLKVKEITTDLQSPQSTDTDIKITANASGQGTIQYKFTVTKGSTSETLSSFSTKNTVTWTPSEAGTYTIKVEAKNDKGETAELTKQFVIKTGDVDSDAPVIKSIKANKTAPQPKNSSITFTVNAIGGENVGNGLLFYKFFVTEPNGKEQVVQYYSRKNTYTLKATKEGTYKVRVEVQNADNTTVSKEMSYEIATVVTPTELTLNSFTSSKSSPQQLGTSIVLSADAEGGTGSLTYKYYVKFNGSTTTLSTTTSNTYTWKPTKAGTYTVYVDVTDEDGNKVSDNFSYTIKSNEADNLVINSFTASKQSPQVSGTQVKLTAKATGTGTLQYKFLIKDASGNWAVLRDYGKSNTYIWRTGKAGNKTLYVDVKDSNGQVTRKSMSYTITAAAPTVTSFTADKKSPQASGTQLLLMAQAAGEGELQYKFLVKDASGNWFVIQDYSSSNIAIWKAGKTGNKTLYVDVKDSNGKVTRKSISYTIK